MQKIIRQNKNVHPILDEIDSVYTMTSDVAVQSLINPTFDKSFESLIHVFYEYWYESYNVDFIEKSYEGLSTNYNNKMILAFSGGKDSIASALKFRDAGYDVYLYHMKKVNRSFSDEWECAKECAEILDMPIFFDEIGYSGSHMWMEHPMKNMIIANGALSYGIREGITTNIAFGNYTTSLLIDNPFDRCAGDCMDMWECYEPIIQRILPDFKIHCNLDNVGETLEIVLKHPKLYEHSHSCLCRHSLRPYRNNWVKEKFGVTLPKLRCGSCYKCAMEYIYMADHDLAEFNEAYYKYCLNQLLKVMIAEGTTHFTVRAIWEHYMFYDISESKIYDKIDNTNVLLGGIRWL